MLFAVVEGVREVPVSAADALGVTHVAGQHRFSNMPFLLEGARQVRKLGANTILIHMSPNYLQEYPDAREAYGNEPIASLTDLAKSPQFKALFEMPFETYVITAFSFGTWEWANSFPRPEFGDELAARERSEIYNLTAHLMTTYAGTGKRFIIKNWEGDWFMNQSYDTDASSSP